MGNTQENISVPQIRLEIAPEPCEPCQLCQGPTTKVFTPLEIDSAEGQPYLEITNVPSDWCASCDIEWGDVGAIVAAYEAGLAFLEETGADEITIARVKGSIRIGREHLADFSQ